MSLCKLTIGNGFDLFCSLKTQYKDFFESEEQKKIFNAIDEYEKKCFSNDDVVNKIPLEFLHKSTTVWDILFCKWPARLKKKDWCDIEQFIFDFFYDKKETKGKSDNKKKETKGKSNNKEKDDDSSFTKIYVNVKANIKKERIKLNDLSNWQKAACVYLILKKVPTYRKDEYISFWLQELQKFEKRFGEYVYNEFEEKKDKYSVIYKDFFKNNVPGNLRVSSLDSFNYTPIECYKKDFYFSKSNEKISLPNNIKHINGDYNVPIFGIDSSKFDIDDPGHFFTKTYRRITADFFEGENFKAALDQKFEDLIIFGHSLNEQDYNYYFPIFDFMNLMDVTADSTLYFLYYIYDKRSKNKIKRDNTKRLYAMLNAYEEYKTGKTKEHRLVDSLSSRGRLRFKEVNRPAVL